MRKCFWLLVNKNLIVESKCYTKTSCEIIIIAAIFMLTISIDEWKSKENGDQTIFHRGIVLNNLTHFKRLLDITSETVPFKLYYTPNNENTKQIVEVCVKQLNLDGSRGFNNESELLKQFDSKIALAGLVFKGNDLVLRFPCYLRTNRKKKLYKMSDFWLTRCSGVIESYDRDNLEHIDFYDREGFLQLLYCTYNAKNGQNMKLLDMISIFHTQEPDVGCVNGIKRRAMSSDTFLSWFLYSLIFLLPFLNLLWKFSREHEENIFAHNLLYGFTYATQRLAHFLVALLHLLLLDLVVLLLVTLIWSPMSILQIIYMFSILIINNMLLIVFAMILATLLANGKTAVWCGATLWVIAYTVFSEVLINLTVGLNWKTFIKFALFFNNMIPSCLVYVKENEDLNLSAMIDLLGLLSLVLFLYLSLLQCSDYLFPGLYSNCYRYKADNNKSKKKRKTIIFDEPNRTAYQNNYEYGPLNGKVLELENVYTACTEQYKKTGYLKGISMSFFKNEISVVTGANGSGKTSLITIIAGWKFYQGHIRFYRGNEEIITNWNNYRQYIDVVMPNNPLYDELTVKETLKYFIELKYPQQEEQVKFEMSLELDKWLNILQPTINNPQKRVKDLSFGEKRLLSLCCALSCNTTVVLLYEPTLHMKAEHQYKYWDILKQEKQERCIIVTTISIDEANEIGDRIGILHRGHLMGWGTSFYLRTTFDVGFYLICFLQPSKPIKPITELLEQYITDIKIQQHFFDRVIYILPSNKKSLFQRILIDLEKDFVKLGITNLYVTGCHLNDVYMTLTSEPVAKDNTLPDLKKTLTFLDENAPTCKKTPKNVMFYKKLFCQAKNSLPVWAIFISCFLIFAFKRMKIESLNKDSILFANDIQNIQSEKPNVEIAQVKDLKSGLFVYEKVLNDDISYKDRKVWHPSSMSGIKAGDSNITLWYNEKIFHSAPLAMHLAFKYMNYEGNFINKPIEIKTNRDIHLTLGIITPLTMSMVFVALNEERFNNMMTLQRIAGLTDTQFWLSTFIWDYIVYLLICLLYLILLIADSLRWQKVFAAYFLFVCGMLSLIFIYLMTLFIQETSRMRAYFKIFLLQLAIGILPYVLYINIMQNYTDIVFYVLLLFPGFAILHGTSKIFNNNVEITFSTYFRWNYPGFMDSACFLTSVAFTLLMIFIVIFIGRKKHLQSTPKKIRNFASVCYPYDDQRVVKEKVRISNMNIRACRSQSVVVDQLENLLPKTGNRIKGISFALNTYTCFGIYGSYASGKSHLLKQLIGEVGFWFGEVYMAGFSCKHQMTKAAHHVGYCPQGKGFNALLTPREILLNFLMITGVIKSEHLDILRELSITLKLRKYMNTRMELLPYNIQRRVNVAIALIAHNEILIFDEPTKGLAAFDRQLIWSILKHCRSLGNTIIFTSTDTLELKELADEIIVVNDGEMLAYDNPHAIEFQYNVGFFLEIKVYNDGITLEEVAENLRSYIENLNRFIMVFHGESEMLYRSGNVVKYYIPVENVTYSYIFGSMEKNRSRLNINDYTITPILLTNALRILQKYRKEKKRHERTRPSVMNPKVLPRRD